MLTLYLTLALVAAGCAGVSLKSYQPKSEDETQVIAVLMRISNGMEHKSLGILMLPYADDVYIGNFHKYIGVSSPGSSIRVSKPELAQAYNQLFRATKEISMDITGFKLNVAGDRAVAEGRIEILYKLEAGRKEAREDYVRADVVWRMKRTPMGWKIVEEVYQ
jgi:hypothetical protein